MLGNRIDVPPRRKKRKKRGQRKYKAIRLGEKKEEKNRKTGRIPGEKEFAFDSFSPQRHACGMRVRMAYPSYTSLFDAKQPTNPTREVEREKEKKKVRAKVRN